MIPLTLQEFAEDMRRKGDTRLMDFADEILDLLVLEEEVAEPYKDLCLDISFLVPGGLEENPAKSVEWLGDRSNNLEEIGKHLNDAGHTGTDLSEVVKNLCSDLREARATLVENGLREYDL